jgi:hypothetical protein
MTLVYNNKVVFDDFVSKEDAMLNSYSQICDHCVSKHNVPVNLLDPIPVSDMTCGVEGCNNEADYYIDFCDNEIKYTCD